MSLKTSPLLENFPHINHAFTTKKSGNLAFHVDDNSKNVLTNHKLLANSLKYPYKSLIHMKQIHSNIVHIVDNFDTFNTPPTCDALITNKKNTPLMVMVADCAPILFYDSAKEVIAVAHSGRAGTFNNIIQETVDCFKKNFNTQISDIVVSVGANICQECYEVGEEIFEEGKNLGFEYAFKKNQKEYYLNIRAILKQELLEAGILKFEISTECNSCLRESYFSYRGEGKTGRFAGVIELT